jgi:hypothetical protein
MRDQRHQALPKPRFGTANPFRGFQRISRIVVVAARTHENRRAYPIALTTTITTTTAIATSPLADFSIAMV